MPSDEAASSVDEGGTMSGTLFLVAMPIGNLGDITHRAVETLRRADYIVAEDTRTSKRVLDHYGIDTPFFSSLYQGVEQQRIGALLTLLSEGKSLALVSDAGTPLISDPGFTLVRAAIDAGAVVVPIPGPCAAIAGLIGSGLPTDRFYFGGALPRSRADRKRVIDELSFRQVPSVFYESCHRLMESLELLCERLPMREIVLARELTKLHEEYLRGTACDLLGRLRALDRLRGEFVLLVSGSEAAWRPSEEAERSAIEVLQAEGVSRKVILRVLAEAFGVPRNEAYRRLHLGDEGCL